MVQFIDPVTNYGQLPGLMQGADPDYGMKLQQLQAARAFQGGVPTDANGNPDFMAMAKKYYQVGAPEQGNQMLQTGMLMSSMNGGASLDDPLGKMAAAGGPSGASSAAQPAGGGYMPKFGDAIASVESGGKYDALGPQTDSGDRAYGKYQVMGANVGPWTQEVLGTAMTPQQFLANPQAQDAVFNAKFGSFVKQTGSPAGAASMWFTGKPLAQGANLSDVNGTTGSGYVAKFLGALRGGQPGGSAPTPTAPPAAGQPSAPAPSTAGQPSGAPVRLAMNGASDAPMGVHPFGPQAAGAGNPGGPAGAGDASGAQTAPQPAPQAAPPQAAAAAQTVPGMPQNYPGGAGQYLIDLETRLSHLLNTPMAANYAKALEAQIKQVEATLSPTNEQKNAADPTVQASQMKLAEARGGARAAATAQFALVPVQQPDGSVTLMPKTQALAQAAAGNAPIKSLPGYVTSGQQNLLTKLNDGSAAYTERQIASTRLDALGDLLSTYQTGANSDAFNHAAAYARSLGIAIPNSATINPAAMQQFTKDAYANVLSNMKEQGNKQFVSEVQSAINSNPNTDLQPEANAAMIAQMKGIQNFHDQNFQDYANWYDGNKGASNDAQFQIAWAKQHPLDQYIQSARKNIAPLGVPVPPKNQLVDGQAYMLKNGVKASWNAAKGRFFPVTNGSAP